MSRKYRVVISRAAFHSLSNHSAGNTIFHKCVLFHTDLTTKSAGLGCATFDSEGLEMNFTACIMSNWHSFRIQKKTRLTSSVNPGDQVEAVDGQTRRDILEVANGACGMIDPRINANTALRGEREGQVFA